MAKKRLFQTNQSIERLDGQLAFSPQARALYDRRSSSKKGGRIKKVLGEDDTFSPEFKSAFDPDNEHYWILERVHLRKELEAAKKLIKALRKFPNDNEAQKLLKALMGNPTNRKKDCLLCPIWRHERELEVISALVPRYVFPRVRDQLYLLTVVFDFAENLAQLEEAVVAAGKAMRAAEAFMGRKGRGMVIAGCFEPDLKSHEQLVREKKCLSMLRQLGIEPSDAGGWILTGHFFVRVPHKEDLDDWLRETFPANGWVRVQFKQINKDRSLIEHLIRIFSYVGKMPKPLFDPPSRETADGSLRKSNEAMRSMSAAFYGALSPSIDDRTFNVENAIVQWAKFMTKLGPQFMYFARENGHAQKWYSESELDYMRATDGDMLSDGRHKIEIRRDQGPFPPSKTLPHLVGKMRTFRSRPLKRDREWEVMTDCTGINVQTHYHDFDRYTLKPITTTK